MATTVVKENEIIKLAFDKDGKWHDAYGKIRDYLNNDSDFLVGMSDDVSTVSFLKHCPNRTDFKRDPEFLKAKKIREQKQKEEESKKELLNAANNLNNIVRSAVDGTLKLPEVEPVEEKKDETFETKFAEALSNNDVKATFDALTKILAESVPKIKDEKVKKYVEEQIKSFNKDSKVKKESTEKNLPAKPDDVKSNEKTIDTPIISTKDQEKAVKDEEKKEIAGLMNLLQKYISPENKIVFIAPSSIGMSGLYDVRISTPMNPEVMRVVDSGSVTGYPSLCINTAANNSLYVPIVEENRNYIATALVDQIATLDFNEANNILARYYAPNQDVMKYIDLKGMQKNLEKMTADDKAKFYNGLSAVIDKMRFEIGRLGLQDIPRIRISNFKSVDEFYMMADKGCLSPLSWNYGTSPVISATPISIWWKNGKVTMKFGNK